MSEVQFNNGECQKSKALTCGECKWKFQKPGSTIQRFILHTDQLPQTRWRSCNGTRPSLLLTKVLCWKSQLYGQRFQMRPSPSCTIEPQISDEGKNKPWVWMDKLRAHYTGTTGSSVLTDWFMFWASFQGPHESIQEWEVKVRHIDSLCCYSELRNELCWGTFIFGLNANNMRSELLKTHVKPDNSKETVGDVVTETRKQTN